MLYQFERTVEVAGVLRCDGEIVDAADLPAGSVGSLLRMGHMVPFVAAPAAPTPPPASAPAYTPAPAHEPEPEPSPELPPHAPARQAHPKRPAKK